MAMKNVCMCYYAKQLFIIIMDNTFVKVNSYKQMDYL